jgi:hypothetical protein
MKLPRIRPYKTFLVDDDGKRTRLDAHEIVLERPIGWISKSTWRRILASAGA